MALKASTTAIVAPDVSTPSTPMSLIERAVTNGASVETLERLMTLQERREATQARKAYITAMSMARKDFAPIVKSNDGYKARYKFETLDDVLAAVGGPLADNGFSFDWITEDQPNGYIRVTCVVTHEDGHQRTNSMSGDPKAVADAGANMNGMQRVGAVVTYLQRYTLKAALGVAAAKDTDAAADEPAPASAPAFDLAPWKERLTACNGNVSTLKAFAADLKKVSGEVPPPALKEMRALWAEAMQAAEKKEPANA